jgi:predicted GNAT family N-acyltransferase
MTSGMQLVEFAHGSAGYRELVRLRDLHLRQPIGLRLREEDLAGEEFHRHFALLENQQVVGGLIAVPLDPATAKLRQMWVQPERRGLGCGRELLTAVERRLAVAGVTSFVLHARENASGFYARQGYHVVGGPFEEVGRPHLRMEKHPGIAPGGHAVEKPACAPKRDG